MRRDRPETINGIRFGIIVNLVSQIIFSSLLNIPSIFNNLIGHGDSLHSLLGVSLVEHELTADLKIKLVRNQLENGNLNILLPSWTCNDQS